MLVMFTNYDPITTVLAQCAQKFLDIHRASITAFVAPETDDWHHPHEWLLQHQRIALLFFGHGTDEPAMFVSQAKIGFVDIANINLLSGRFVCAVCCHSVNGIGRHVAAVEATIVGYEGKLGVPLKDPYATRLADCILTGLEKIRDNEPAYAVSKAKQDAYRAMAQDLYKGSALDCLMAPIFEGNAEAVTIAGDPNRRPNQCK